MLKRMMLMMCLSCVYLMAIAQQSGIITGTITDENLQPVSGATISLNNNKTVAVADSAGRYTLKVAPGTYEVTISAVSFKTQVITVQVAAGETATYDAVVEPEAGNLDQVVVTGRRSRTAETAMVAERKASNLVIQKIGAQELERKGSSNVAEGVAKVTGVSFVGGQQLFIRGLGDRYNNAILNGLPVPSPNPDMKVIPLDLFPAGLVNSLSVIKSYSSNFYGDFSGGTIDITTKDYPEKRFFKIGISGGANSIVTGKDFYSSVSNFNTYSGFTRNDRALPQQAQEVVFYNSDPNNKENPFKTPFSPAKKTALPKIGLTISGGDIIRFGDGKAFGYSINAAYKNNYQIYRGVDRLLNANKVELFTNNLDNHRFLTNASVLGSAYFKASDRTSFKYSLLFVNDSQDEVSHIDGINPDFGPVYSILNTNIQNSILVNQLNGKHELSDKFTFNWAGSYGVTKGSMPDRTQVAMLNNGVANHDERVYYFHRDVLGNTSKFFGNLSETEPSGKVEIEYNNAEETGWLKNVKLGIDARYKQRKFNARQVDVRTTAMRNPVNPNNIDSTLTVDRINDGFVNNTWAFTETYYPTNNYKANLAIGAAYGLTSISVGSKTDLIGGVRAEYSDQTVFYKQSNDIFDRPLRAFNRKNWDILPFVTIKHRRTEKNNILLSASRSLTRPLFLELTPFRFNQGFNRLPREGNPFLKNSVNYNADIKFELYPKAGELLAFTVFGKYILDPIEQALIISSDRLTSFFNSEKATVWGAEVEWVRNIGNLFNSNNTALNNTSIGLNAAYIHTEITIDPENVNSFYPISPTNKKRPMFGASPYLVNADVTYKQPWGGKRFSQATLAYNVYGKRVVFAGTFGSGDVYEMPAGTLDFVLNNQISNRVNLDLSIGNILNPAIRQRQFFGDEGVIVNQYMRGASLSLSFGYSF